MSIAATPSAAQTAYRYVKDQILRSELAGGTMLSEGEVASELGVSRTPVREAFLRLESEGWLQLYPKRGALVVPVAAGEADDVLQARLLLEGHGGASIAQQPPGRRADTLGRLRRIVSAQDSALDAGDLSTYGDLDSSFHEQLIDATGNDLLAAFAVTLHERQDRMFAHRTTTLDDARGFVEEHSALIDLLTAGNAEGFRAALAAHLSGAYPEATR
ncbi:GntR family transcriptional regulator [Tessaracoccus lacteus]|uniref:GntR family transcriptional regulator n=1 Tax=Tessaracoccus lacteus TaxID=3041766 RepID=A0ABY8Q0W8_9ACTN|nr:GntR family transcriptional regulator [Tessaracoccus sp. T21]WGT48221.1 GntR family transcriptional regulator [Tessaracoccus sp. T21]